MFDRNPLASVIVRNDNAPNPNEVASLEVELLEENETDLIDTHLIELNILSTNNSEKALEQYYLFLEEIRQLHLNNLKIFDPSKTNLDYFYFRQLGINISHDQVAVEKEFSRGKSSLQYNIKEESIVAKKLVRDHMQANNIKIETSEVPNKLVISRNTAHSCCEASLREKAKEAKKLVENEGRELFQRELSGLIRKQKNLITTCDSLEDEFNRYVAEAEKQTYLTLVIKANTLKRRQTERKTSK